MTAEWVQQAANEIYQGLWMARAKQRHPNGVMLSSEENYARCDCVLGIMDRYLDSHDWLATDHGTIADISCFGSISMLPECVYETDK